MKQTLTAVLGLVAMGLTGCLTSGPDLPSAPYVLALGTAQDGGLPQLGCRRDCCEAARKNPRLKRLVSSLLLVDPRSKKRWLFDASPDLAAQVERARGHAEPKGEGRVSLFDGIFLTHAHLGHYTGLLHLGREAYGTQETPVFATSKMLAFLTSEGPWSLLFSAGHLSASELVPETPVRLAEDLTVTAWTVPHRDEFSDTVCFVIQGPDRKVLFLPDIDKWSRWQRELETVLGEVDLALIDGTFYGPAELPGRDMAEVPHPFIVETLEAMDAMAPDLAQRVLFTHLNHSNPAARTGTPARKAIEARGAAVLAEGQVIELGRRP